MQVNPYLTFKGDCEAAFKFYEQCFGGQLGATFRYGSSAMSEQVPADWQDKLMHANLTIAGRLVLGGDVAPDRYEETKGISLSVDLESSAEAERIFAALASGGKVLMPLEKTFWAARFGVLVDRFGIPWFINCDGSADPPA